MWNEYGRHIGSDPMSSIGSFPSAAVRWTGGEHDRPEFGSACGGVPAEVATEVGETSDGRIVPGSVEGLRLDGAKGVLAAYDPGEPVEMQYMESRSAPDCKISLTYRMAMRRGRRGIEVAELRAEMIGRGMSCLAFQYISWTSGA